MGRRRARASCGFPSSCSARPGAGPIWWLPNRSTRRRPAAGPAARRVAAASRRWPSCDAMARLWRDELGTEPGPAARALHARAQAMPPVDPASLAPGAGAGATRVPRPATHAGSVTATSPLLSLLGPPARDVAGHRRSRQDEAGGRGGLRIPRGDVEADLLYVDLTKVYRRGTRRQLTVIASSASGPATTRTWCRLLEEALQRQAMLLVLRQLRARVEAADLVPQLLLCSSDLRCW